MGRGSMKNFRGVLIAAAALAGAVPGALAQAPNNQPASVVTYIEVTPAAEAETAGFLRRGGGSGGETACFRGRLRAASRKEAGNQRYDVLQHIERRNQFAILEGWSDAKA